MIKDFRSFLKEAGINKQNLIFSYWNGHYDGKHDLKTEAEIEEEWDEFIQSFIWIELRPYKENDNSLFVWIRLGEKALYPYLDQIPTTIKFYNY